MYIQMIDDTAGFEVAVSSAPTPGDALRIFETTMPKSLPMRTKSKLGSLIWVWRNNPPSKKEVEDLAGAFVVEQSEVLKAWQLGQSMNRGTLGSVLIGGKVWAHNRRTMESPVCYMYNERTATKAVLHKDSTGTISATMFGLGDVWASHDVSKVVMDPDMTYTSQDKALGEGGEIRPSWKGLRTVEIYPMSNWTSEDAVEKSVSVKKSWEEITRLIPVGSLCSITKADANVPYTNTGEKWAVSDDLFLKIEECSFSGMFWIDTVTPINVISSTKIIALIPE